MKQKLRDRLDRIEKAITQLSKQIEKLQDSTHPTPNGDDHHEDDGELIPLDRPKAIRKAVTKALGKNKK